MKKFSLGALALTLTLNTYAQIATTTALVGTVTDSSGSVIVGARITAKNAGTLDTYNATTNQDGFYRIDFVRVGTYNVAVEHAGFARVEKTGSVVDMNQVVRNDFSLTPGAITQSVTIEATAALIKTDSAAISESISTKKLSDLPMNGRDPMALAVTTPGVLFGTKGTTGVPPGQDFIGAGTREIQNSMSLDGISIMNNLITTTPTRPMVETVQEVEVQTGTYSAQYGAYMGVHINVVTKGGTNTIHGNVVEFIRNDAFDARPYFLNPALKKTVLRQNQYGFELDGPVYIPKIFDGRDKTFFMGSFEGLRTKRQSASTSTVIPSQFFDGNFSATTTVVKDPANSGNPFPGNIIPTNRISPIALALRKYYVTPNTALLTQNLLTVVPNRTDMDQTVDRVDQNLGSKVRLFFRYQRQVGEYANGNAIPFMPRPHR
jgi:hypothetical protein